MSKLTLEIPDELHQAIKSFAYSHGLTIREFFIEAALEKLKKMSGRKDVKSHNPSSTKKKIDKIVKSRMVKLVKNAEYKNPKSKKRG